MNRTIRRRRGVRIVVMAEDSVLLLNDSDPGIADASWWVTPGGGIDQGEATEQAAVRELREETGFSAEIAALEGPIASRTAVHGYSDRVLVQSELFYLVRTPRFAPEPSLLSPAEARRLIACEWHPLAGLPQPLWPNCLLEMLRRWERDAAVWELGLVEESSVELSENERRAIGQGDALHG